MIINFYKIIIIFIIILVIAINVVNMAQLINNPFT